MAGAGAPAAVSVLPLNPSRAIADSLQFVEYDQRAHKLETLANFAVWVQSRVPLTMVKTGIDWNRYIATTPESALSLSAT